MLGLHRFHQGDAAFGGGQSGLRGFYPGGKRLAFGMGAFRRARRPARLAIKQLIARLRLTRLHPRNRQIAGIVTARRLRRDGPGEEQKPGEKQRREEEESEGAHVADYPSR